MKLLILLYITVINVIEANQTLHCYVCSGGESCGTSFSPNSTHNKIVKSTKSNDLSSCSITVTPEGLTTRSLVAAHECRSSSYQFCCNDDFCNSLPAPPLPAFTSLKCDIGKCSMKNGICIYDDDYVTTLSSPTESCSVTFGSEIYKYYKKRCQPTLREAHVAGIISKASSKSDILCCNSPECNTGHLGSPVRGVAIQCYTCDSRITGLAGCMIFNESSPHVYKAGSSSDAEACATIIGISGRDPTTETVYPTFAIRTFIPNCVNQPFGHVSYGGAYFQGRIECCSSHFCNTQTLDINQTVRRPPLMIIILACGVIVALLIIITIVISYIIYRVCKKRSIDRYGPVSLKEPQVQLDSIKAKLNEKSIQLQVHNDYPEESATP